MYLRGCLLISLLEDSFSSKGNAVGSLLDIVDEFSRDDGEANEEDYESDEFENDSDFYSQSSVNEYAVSASMKSSFLKPSFREAFSHFE